MNTYQAQPKHKMPKKNRQMNSNVITFVSKRDSSYYTDKDKVVSITYEEIGLFPRSFSRVLDRFLKQLFSDVDNLVIQEYRFYRYLFLTTIKTIFILFFLPFLVNFLAKNYIVKPITEYFWNTSHPEIFLNSYEQKRAFVEFEKFEEKIYFETLVESEIGQNILGTNHSLDYLANGFGLASWQNQNPSSAYYTKKDGSSSQDQEFVKQVKFENPKDFLDVKPASVPQLLQSKRSGMQDFASAAQTQYAMHNEAWQAVSAEQTQLASEKEKIEALDYTLTTTPIIKKTKNVSKIYQESASLNLMRQHQEKALELATYYNNHSIEAITNFFADLLSLCTLLYLLITLSIQINITKSFLLEVFFGLDDSKKSLLILLITDLLVGYHSSNLWELFFEFIFNHYGIPESQTGIFLLVATLPVLLDVLFKYLIFRHLNRSSPATVATYQAIIE